MAARAIDVIGMACQDPSCDFKPWKFQRRAPGDFDIQFEVTHCGVCHSDLHTAASHFEGLGVKAKYPCVVGHELSGIVTFAGAKVTKFKVGDQVGVGCMVDSCLQCQPCLDGQEQLCKKPGSMAGVQTYQDPNRHGRAAVWPEGSHTQGGFSNLMVVQERFAIMIPTSYPLECAGPIMCSGVTMYEPMILYGMKKGSRVGIIGLGGLGVMGLKIAHELGCVAVAISRGAQKAALAKKAGADEYIDSKSTEALKEKAGSLNLIINTIPVYHDINVYTGLLAPDGHLVLVGLTPTFLAAQMGVSKVVKHSIIGGIKNTEAVLAICDRAQPKILPEIMLKPVQDLNWIFEQLDKSNDSGIRYVLDIKGSLGEKTFGTCQAPAPTLSTPEGMSMKMVLHEIFKLMGCICCQG